uniref:Uncharacterized protein n=1 Tax=Rhizophora mucronata TaxID=61149 RepID=A0A2P2Q1K0_RHIMU
MCPSGIKLLLSFLSSSG